MLSKIIETRNFSATSSVTDGANISYPVMYMSASVVDGKVNINKTIQDNDIYMNHQEEILQDYSAFENQVMETTLQERRE